MKSVGWTTLCITLSKLPIYSQSVSQSVIESDSQSVSQSVIELPDWDTMSTHVFSVILLGSTASDPGKNALDALVLPSPNILEGIPIRFYYMRRMIEREKCRWIEEEGEGERLCVCVCLCE